MISFSFASIFCTLLLLLVGICSTGHQHHVAAYVQVPVAQTIKKSRLQPNSISSSRKSPIVSDRFMANGDSEDDSSSSYSREVRLRVESENPLRKIRYFLYVTAAGGAATSLFISVARVGAALSGVNADLMEESVTNTIIDVVALATIGFFYKRDSDAEQSRLERATKGAEMAKLSVRASKRLLYGGLGDGTSESQDGTFTTTLASLRRGRGIEKRVAIVAAGSDKIIEVLQQAKSLEDDLMVNDIVIVPVVMPEGKAPSMTDAAAAFGDGNDDGDDKKETMIPTCIMMPITIGGTSSGNNWKDYIDQESVEAMNQGVDIEKDGFCIILKKNGRIGQRTRGIYLENLLSNVIARRDAGMDVTNI